MTATDVVPKPFIVTQPGAKTLFEKWITGHGGIQAWEYEKDDREAVTFAPAIDTNGVLVKVPDGAKLLEISQDIGRFRFVKDAVIVDKFNVYLTVRTLMAENGNPRRRLGLTDTSMRKITDRVQAATKTYAAADYRIVQLPKPDDRKPRLLGECVVLGLVFED